MSALKKEEKQTLKEKGASARNLEEKKKVRREVKMDKCPIVELGVQDTQGREKKNIEHLILFIKFQKARKVCIPSKEQK